MKSKLGLRAAGNYTSLQKLSLQELRKPQQRVAAVAVVDQVGPQGVGSSDARSSSAAVAKDVEHRPQEASSSVGEKFLHTEVAQTRSVSGPSQVGGALERQ